MSVNDNKVEIVKEYENVFHWDKQMCRLCLKHDSNIDIFAEDQKVLNKIQSCCTFEIFENDGFPDRICITCMSTLDTAVNFKHQCEESDKILRKNYDIANSKIDNLLVPIKKEEFDSDFDNNFDDGHPLGSFYEAPVEIKDEDFDYHIKSKKKSKSKDKHRKIRTLAVLKRAKSKSLKKSLEAAIEDIKPLKKRKKRITGPRCLSNLCPFCGKVFLKVHSLNSHIKKHSTEKPHCCSVCPKAFRDKSQMKEHMKIHCEVKEFPCEVCGKLFKTTYDARRHTEIVHKKSRVVQCKLCGKRLATNFGYKMHMKTHTGEKEFECEVCKQKFTFKYSLTLHQRIHTGEKPYSCKFCDGKFSALKTVKEHERIHTGETPYNCPICTKGFSQLSNMKSHFRNNHRGLEFDAEYKRSRREAMSD